MIDQLIEALQALIAWMPTCEASGHCAEALIGWFTLLISWLVQFI